MNLLLVRHAHATWESREWANDLERPLTELGNKQSARLGAALRAAMKPADRLFSSPFVRAKQTAQIIATEAGWPDPTVHEPDFTGSDHRSWVKGLLESFQQIDVETLAYVGHEPTLSQLITLLLTGNDEQPIVEMDPSSAALLRFAGPPLAGSASLVWLVSPDLLAEAES